MTGEKFFQRKLIVEVGLTGAQQTQSTKGG